MLAVIGFVCQLKITHYAYKVGINMNSLVEKKFQSLYKDYIFSKNEVEKSIEQANEAYKEKKILLFKNNLKNAEFEYKMLCDKLRSIENDIIFTTEEIPVYPKILSPLSMFGNLLIQYYRWDPSSNLLLVSNILSTILNIIFGVLGFYYAYNTQSIDEKLKVINLEKIEIERTIKHKIKMLKRNEFYFQK